jgi:hypothetical protein
MGVAAASDSVSSVWTSDTVIETEQRRNCLVHLRARYWVRVVSGLSLKKRMHKNRLIFEKLILKIPVKGFVFTTVLTIAPIVSINIVIR